MSQEFQESLARWFFCCPWCIQLATGLGRSQIASLTCLEPRMGSRKSALSRASLHLPLLVVTGPSPYVLSRRFMRGYMSAEGSKRPGGSLLLSEKLARSWHSLTCDTLFGQSSCKTVWIQGEGKQMPPCHGKLSKNLIPHRHTPRSFLSVFHTCSFLQEFYLWIFPWPIPHISARPSPPHCKKAFWLLYHASSNPHYVLHHWFYFLLKWPYLWSSASHWNVNCVRAETLSFLSTLWLKSLEMVLDT